MARLTYRRRLELQVWAQAHAFEPNREVPEDWPEEWRLGPSGLPPTYCGDHTPGFIGLYAIINGLALLLAEVEPLKPSEERMLLEAGWKFLSARGPIAPWYGIRTATFERLAHSLVYALCRHRGQWVRCDRIEAHNLAHDIIALTLERLMVAKRVMIILLGRSHYTVLRGFTPISWLLFDAAGRVWMKRAQDDRFAGPSWRTKTPFILTLSRSI